MVTICIIAKKFCEQKAFLIMITRQLGIVNVNSMCLNAVQRVELLYKEWDIILSLSLSLKEKFYRVAHHRSQWEC